MERLQGSRATKTNGMMLHNHIVSIK